MVPSAPEFSTSKNINALIAQRIRGMGSDKELQILEAGCGRKWPIDLSGARYRLTGVDLDAKALESRKNEVRDLHEAVVGDLRSVDFPRAHFDVIYSAFVLEHVKGAQEVLEKFVYWLRPGGLLILQVPDRNSVYGFFARTTPFWFHVFYAKHFNEYYRRTGTAGKPGHGPYPTHHDVLIGRAEFREFAAEHSLELEQEYGFHRLPAAQQVFATAVSLLTLRRLASSHIDLCYIARRVPDAAVPDAATPVSCPPVRSAPEGARVLASQR
jgi:2-polyprenyl-3-methyl-5-hydroxy-6-metoxy-1,4-benzoquinol methylase